MIKFLWVFVTFIISFAATSAPNPVLKDVDPICLAYVKQKKFAPADTVYWETRVLPEFESVIKDPKFKKSAQENLNYKMALAEAGYDANKIEARNNQRIITEANKAGFDKAYTTRLNCSRNFISKTLPHAVDSFLLCLKKENRENGCGASFQTAQGIQTNLNVIKKIDKDFNALLLQGYKDPVTGAYLEDVSNAYKEFSLQVKYAMERGEKEIEKAKAAELKTAKAQYASDTKQFKELLDAEKIFGRCKGYLKKAGFNDDADKNIINQISHCQNPDSDLDQNSFNNQMKSVEKIGESMQKQSMLELAQTLFAATHHQTQKSYLMGYYRIHGKLPSESEFKAKLGVASYEHPAAYRDATFEIQSTPKLDVDGEMALFNLKVEELNRACALYQSKKDGTSGNKVNEAYQNVLQKTAFGSLMSIKSFKKKIGEFNKDDCRDDGTGLKLLAPSDKDKVISALDSTLDVLATKGQELRNSKRELLDEKDPYKGIKYFLRYNPLIVNRVLAGKIDPDQAALLCLETKKLYQDEKNDEFWNSALAYASMGGALVATVLTGGAAAPLLVLSIAAGSINSLNAINQADIAENNYRASLIDGSANGDISSFQAEKYDLKGKIETVGLVMNFVPGAVGVVAKEAKIFTTPLMKSSMAVFVKNSQVWAAGAKMTKPVSTFLGKISSGAAVTMGELELALASRIGPKTAQSVVTSFTQFAAGIPQDAALVFGTMALAYPDPPGPYSEEGFTDLIYGTAMSRGFAMIPMKFRDYRFKKKYEANLQLANEHFNGLQGEQRIAFEAFQKEVNFSSLPVQKQEEILLRMFEVHKGNNVAAGEKVSFGKVMDIAEFKKELVNMGVSETVANTQVRHLASDEIMILGQRTPGSASGAKPMALSQKDFESANAIYRSYDSGPKVLEHLRGEFEFQKIPGKPGLPKLDGGLHTIEGVDFLKKIRPDVARQISLKELPNGVIKVDIPESVYFQEKFNRIPEKFVYTKKVDGEMIRYTQKALFPKAWSDQQVLNAINAVKSKKANLYRVDDRGEVFHGNYQGMEIKVVVGRNGQVITAYPNY